MTRSPKSEDVRSVFCGLRPLISSDTDAPSSQLSRSHQIQVARSGLIHVLGGKWTTYRKMAEDAVDAAQSIADLPDVPCRTATLPIHGYDPGALGVEAKPDDGFGLTLGEVVNSFVGALEGLMGGKAEKNAAMGENGEAEAVQRESAWKDEGAEAVQREEMPDAAGVNEPCGQGSLRWQTALSTYGTDLHDMMERYEPVDFESISARLFLCPAQVKWAVEFEMAQTLEDVLARRTACLFLDVEESLRIAPQVATIMADLMSCTPEWTSQQIDAFSQVARYFRIPEH
jgi:glycerol-3-phosphate dehydrogenase